MGFSDSTDSLVYGFCKSKRNVLKTSSSRIKGVWPAKPEVINVSKFNRPWRPYSYSYTFMFIHTAGNKRSFTCVLNTLTQRLYHVVVHSEKMASKTKRSRPNRIRHRIETECETEAEKESLARRLDRIRQLLTPPGSRGIDNGTMLNAMYDIMEREAVLPARTWPLRDSR